MQVNKSVLDFRAPIRSTHIFLLRGNIKKSLTVLDIYALNRLTM